MTGIYLGLGSNLGDRRANLARCLTLLDSSGTIQLSKISSVYESEPYGLKNQPWFLNMVIKIDTQLEPLPLLQNTEHIEKQMRRVKTGDWGPRIIDIDILSYHDIILKHPMLNIPHRQLHLRRFVLLPLKEIAACFIHPGLKKNVNQLIMDCQDKSIVDWFMDGNELLKGLG